MPRPRKNIDMDFAEITESLMKGETVRLKVLAARYGTCSPVVKRRLEEYYGDKIAFVYGRGGGVRLSVIAPEWWRKKMSASGTHTVSPPDLTGVA
jgi:hypothetical protein